jgi:hypothetical protein
MSTKTTTAVTHYHIQKKRRAEFIEEWRKNRRTVIRQEDVVLTPTARGLRSGVYMGSDGDSPTRCLDVLVHEIDAGVIATPGTRSFSSSKARAGARSMACATTGSLGTRSIFRRGRGIATATKARSRRAS